MNTLGQISLFLLDLSCEFMSVSKLRVGFSLLGLGGALKTIYLCLETALGPNNKRPTKRHKYARHATCIKLIYIRCRENIHISVQHIHSVSAFTHQLPIFGDYRLDLVYNANKKVKNIYKTHFTVTVLNN